MQSKPFVAEICIKGFPGIDHSVNQMCQLTHYGANHCFRRHAIGAYKGFEHRVVRAGRQPWHIQGVPQSMMSGATHHGATSDGWTRDALPWSHANKDGQGIGVMKAPDIAGISQHFGRRDIANARTKEGVRS